MPSLSAFIRWRETFRHRPAYAPLRALLGCIWVGAAVFVANALAKAVLPPSGKALGPLLLAAAALAGYWLFVRIVERRPVAELASRRWPVELLLGCAIGAGLFAAVIGVLALFGSYAVKGVNPWQAALPVLSVSIMAGVVEELIVRAVIFRILEGWIGSWRALAFSAVLFGALHLANANATVLSSAAIAIEAGIMLGAAFMVTRHVWLPIGIHLAWNFTQSGIFGVATSGIALTGWLRGELSGPPWLSGGTFGPEASVVAVAVCVAAGLVMIRRAMARGHVVPPSWQRPPDPLARGAPQTVAMKLSVDESPAPAPELAPPPR